MHKNSLKNLFKIAILPSLAIYISILFITSNAGIETSLVLRDLLQTCDYPIGVGMISSLGVILWAAASAICLFSYTSNLINKKSYKRLVIIGGFFSGLLCLDDLFLLHDKKQINQDILYTIYIALAIFLIIKFGHLIKEIDIYAFLGSAFLLALSVISDIFQDFLPINYETVQILEEGFKFIGITAWLYFWNKASYKAISSSKNN